MFVDCPFKKLLRNRFYQQIAPAAARLTLNRTFPSPFLLVRSILLNCSTQSSLVTVSMSLSKLRQMSKLPFSVKFLSYCVKWHVPGSKPGLQDLHSFLLAELVPCNHVHPVAVNVVERLTRKWEGNVCQNVKNNLNKYISVQELRSSNTSDWDVIICEFLLGI